MTHDPVRRRLALHAPLALAAAGLAPAVRAEAFPSRPIELVVPFQAGGGTDALARAYAEAARTHFGPGVVVVNRPGASGAIGWNEVIRARPDGHKLAVITVELVTLPPLGLAKFTHEDLEPIVRLNADPAAITVRADAPWPNLEAFLAAVRAKPQELRMGNSGNGSIWHLAAAALEDRTGLKFAHIPFQGAAPAVQALLGGHIEAVAVSPAEVGVHVAGGKLRLLGVMAEQRPKGFEAVPTLKERGIDLAIGTWRGLAAPRGTPADALTVLRAASARIAQEPVMLEAMTRLNLGISYGDAATFRSVITRDATAFRQLIGKLDLKA